jgi:predicted transcriptional regulator
MTITFRIPDPLAKQLRALAASRHQTVSQFLRMVTEERLARVKRNQKKEQAA